MKDLMLGSNKYVRGPSILKNIGNLTSHIGKHAMIIGGKTALSVSLKIIQESLEHSGINCSIFEFTTDVTLSQVKVFSKLFYQEHADFIIGVGGGKAIDCSKWVADECKASCVTVPTSAATCACMVSLIVRYNDDGTAAGGIYAQESPILCIADTDIILKAPTRLIYAGIADTLVKWPETYYTMRTAADDTFKNLTAWLSRNIFDSICQDIKSKAFTDTHFFKEDIVDLIFLFSGLVGNIAGSEYRLGVAHSIHDGLIALDHQKTKRFLHGEKVAYGTLVQLALLEESNEDLKTLYSIFKKFKLPISLHDFGFTTDDNTLETLIEKTCQGRLEKGPATTNPQILRDAILEIENYQMNILVR